MIWQTFIYQNSALIIFCLPLEYTDPYPLLLSSGWHRSLSYLPLDLMSLGSVIERNYFFPSVNLSYVNLIIRPTEEPRMTKGECFLADITQRWGDPLSMQPRFSYYQINIFHHFYGDYVGNQFQNFIRVTNLTIKKELM